MTTKTLINDESVTQFSTKETAGAIRAALKAAFSATKFSVRISIYSMGSSTYVSWTDGPTTPEVEAVTSRFTSKSFDGSDDSTHYHTQIVNGERVQYSGYITTIRKVSDELRAMAERRAAVLGEDNVNRVLRNLRPNGCRVILKAGA